ncbi:patatin-like phospholipase [Variibacter gotjawalensis]|uniref:Patatin-like phospholipase n=1 Tax=Variibacter gotjawalensis TaxID=1333996 RepID=A0A0S3PPR1_9BRAD|nr:patatin-like phospholipase family protein [Variibacter gotjawalensis]NIK48212.1 NTE family protein [Variibacter gotjawalensis]RZS50083.1 NTE family protein [Variibacter gotjawalensis]BAT57914.1 patatin-like phospholipase [Variibacter gotjawalensis]
MKRKKLHLALQGGGAHGAFTWGVLDRLLDEEKLAIDGVSGASAGAVNAVLLVDGLARGGPREAEKRLADFWRATSRDGSLSNSERAVVDRLFWFMPMAGSPLQSWYEAWSQVFSPYDLNPLNLNPLRDLIERFVDFEAVRKAKNPLFVSATNVQTGKLRVFSREQMSADVIAASACLPQLFRAVEIDNVPYWDGGYVGNPTLFPLFQKTDSDCTDVLIVQINPLERTGTPTSHKDIMNRVNEVTFNSSLLSELREIALVSRLIEAGQVTCGTGKNEYRRINVHRIVLGTSMGLDADSKLNNDYDFFLTLRKAGVRAARRFLDAHFDDIGVKSTVDLDAEVQAEWG